MTGSALQLVRNLRKQWQKYIAREKLINESKNYLDQFCQEYWHVTLEDLLSPQGENVRSNICSSDDYYFKEDLIRLFKKLHDNLNRIELQ